MIKFEETENMEYFITKDGKVYRGFIKIERCND